MATLYLQLEGKITTFISKEYQREVKYKQFRADFELESPILRPTMITVTQQPQHGNIHVKWELNSLIWVC